MPLVLSYKRPKEAHCSLSLREKRVRRFQQILSRNSQLPNLKISFCCFKVTAYNILLQQFKGIKKVKVSSPLIVQRQASCPRSYFESHVYHCPQYVVLYLLSQLLLSCLLTFFFPSNSQQRWNREAGATQFLLKIVRRKFTTSLWSHVTGQNLLM